MGYKEIEKVGSPRIHLLNTLKANDIFSEFPKEGFTRVVDEVWYYFSEELLEKEFQFSECTHGKTSGVFKDLTGYSRPRINTYIEKYLKIFYFSEGYYDLRELKLFIQENMKDFIEKRWRPTKK